MKILQSTILSLMSYTALSFTVVPSAQSAEVLLSPPDYDYQQLCEARPALDEKIHLTKLRSRRFSSIAKKDLLEILDIYYKGRGPVAPDYTYARKIIEYFERLPRNTRNTRLIDAALLTKAHMQKHGQSYPRSKDGAKKTLRSLMSRRSIGAYNLYAHMLIQDQQYGEAYELYKQSAAFGNRSAYYSILRMYHEGQVQSTDEQLQAAVFNAQNAMLNSIASGDCAVLYQFSGIYKRLRELPNAQDYANRWVEKAALTSDALAKLELVKLIRNGAMQEGKSYTIHSLLKEAAALGSSDAMYQLGEYYLYQQDDYKNSIKWLEKSSLYRNEDAAELLVRIYKGDFELARDNKKLRYWLERAVASKQPRVSLLEELISVYEFDDTVNDEKRISLYRKAADRGSASAMVKLGDAYRYGLIKNSQPIQALRYYRYAASLGSTTAMRRLAGDYRCEARVSDDNAHLGFWDEQLAYYSAGYILDPIYKELYKNKHISDEHMQEALRMSMRRQNTAASVLVGVYHHIKSDSHAAQEWFDKALNGDERKATNYDAHYQLSRLYYDGTILPFNSTKAMSLLQESAQAGNNKAYFLLARIYEKQKDYVRAIDAYQAAITLGNTSAYKRLYRLYEKLNMEEKAASVMTSEARKHNIDAMLTLVARYDSSSYRNPTKARYWLERAVAGKPCQISQQLTIARYYLTGIAGGNASPEKAEFWIRELQNKFGSDTTLEFYKALLSDGSDLSSSDKDSLVKSFEKLAEDGNNDAIRVVSELMIERINDEDVDMNRTIYWLEKSANAGNIDAMMTLSNLYYNGHKVLKSNDKALYWLRMAAKEGDPFATKKLTILQNDG